MNSIEERFENYFERSGIVYVHYRAKDKFTIIERPIKLEDIFQTLTSELEAQRKEIVEILEKEYLKAKNAEFKAGIAHAQNKIKEIKKI